MFKLADGSVVSQAELDSRKSKDFKFLVLCQAKNKMGMYSLLRDSALDSAVALKKKGVKSGQNAQK